MSGRDELAERIARALAPHMEGGREFDQMPKDRPTLKAWHRANMCSINDATQDDALAAAADFLPIIDAEIAVERERCAGVVDAEAVEFAKSALSTMPKLRAALMEYLTIIAAKIRSLT